MGRETTKRLIAYAFKELLAEKPYNRITVNDIAKKCDINRQTFYYHFHDIIELIEWICESEVESSLKQISTYATWQEGYLTLFELIRKDKVIVTNIYRHTPYEYLTKYLYRVTYQILYNVVSEQAESMSISKKDKEFIANFYKFGFVGLVTEWIDSDMAENPEVIVNRLNTLIEGSVKNALIRLTPIE